MKTNLPTEEFKWDIPTASITEGPTFYVTTPSGMFLLFQMMYSSMNSWSHSVQLTCRLYGKDLKKTISISEYASNFSTFDDGLSAKCGPMSITRLKQDKLGYAIKFDSQGLSLDLVINAVSESFKTKDIHHFDENAHENGWVKSKFVPKASAVGVAIVDGATHDLSGHSCITFVTQHTPHGVGIWNFCNFQAEKNALMLYQLPGDTVQYSQAAIVINNQIEAITLENKTEFKDLEYDSFSGYKIPKSLTNEWSGHTMDGTPINVKMSLKLDNMLDKIDVLGELPYLVKVFLQTFVTAPFVYQYLEDTVVQVTRGSEVFEMNGKSFHEVSFVSETQ